ncbi:MAG: GNAT family N-acetyltransferase [Calothrix sp. C42_A2020_038]|nr:GNAT family N-acetyltransferase [Calothrix sp. C42_A2020_038]
MNLEFLIRLARPEDAEQMHDVHVNAVRQLCTADYTIEQIEAWVGYLDPETRRQYILNGAEDEILFVADRNGIIVGFSCFDMNGEISAIYVHPHYTRRRVGQQLLKAVETKALGYNYKKLEVSASITAIPFYQTQGYKLIEYSSHTLLSGVKIPCAVMEKYL